MAPAGVPKEEEESFFKGGGGKSIQGRMRHSQELASFLPLPCPPPWTVAALPSRYHDKNNFAREFTALRLRVIR